MNNQTIDNRPKISKETKNKIRVEFERTPLKQRLKAKFLSFFFLKKLVWCIVRYVLLIGIAYIVLFPFFSKISASFMARADFIDETVRLVPKHFTLDTYKAIWNEQDYIKAFGNTFVLSFSTAIIQTFICSFIAYGFAKFKFKGRNIMFALVLLTMVIPHRTIAYSLQTAFREFDIFGIVGFLNGGKLDFLGIFEIPWTPFEKTSEEIVALAKSGSIFSANGMNLLNSYWPFIILSLTGLAFKNGLYIFLLRQFFMGVPDELEESAYIDGSGIFRTFFTIILPISIPMMITVFLFSFSWCWTDNFYTSNTMFFTDVKDAPYLLTSSIGSTVPPSLSDKTFKGQVLYDGAIKNTGGLMIIAPLVIMYIFCQKYLVQGIERSGLTAD